MMEAEVGDAVLGDDPTVNELERYAAELLGKERALFFPSGIMANQTALLVLAAPGSEVLIEQGGHILNYEEGGAAAWAGVQLRAVPTPDGLLTARLLEPQLRPDSPYLPRQSVVCLENSHNHAGGRVLRLQELRRVSELARENGLGVHLDGARLPNCSAATGVPLAEWAAPADTVMVSLSKGLGAPVGSVLAGGAGEMERAWRVRRRLGGGMRQAGILAAAGLYALRHNSERITEDHRRARELAAGLGAIPGLRAPVPDTNIVMVEVEEAIDAGALLAGLESREVLMIPFGPRRLRAVLHLDVDDAGVAHAVQAAGEALAARRRTA